MCGALLIATFNVTTTTLPTTTDGSGQYGTISHLSARQGRTARLIHSRGAAIAIQANFIAFHAKRKANTFNQPKPGACAMTAAILMVSK